MQAKKMNLGGNMTKGDGFQVRINPQIVLNLAYLNVNPP